MIKTDTHCLFLEEIEENTEEIEVNGEKILKTVPKSTNLSLFIRDFLAEGSELSEIFNELKKVKYQDNAHLNLYINSNGGYLSEGLQFVNLINNEFKGSHTMYLEASAHSMGALLFCSGEKRVVFPDTDMMLHTYSTGAEGKGAEIKSYCIHADKNYRNLFYKMLVKTKFLRKKEFNEMMEGKDFWFDVEEMCRRGIATHVKHGNEEIEAKEYLKRYHE